MFFLYIAGRFGRVIVTTKDGDPNILRVDVWRELRLLDEIIQNTTAYYDEETFTYHDICAKWMEQCYTNDILNLDKIIDEVRTFSKRKFVYITFKLKKIHCKI